ncbi:MAG TPA: glycosyltransferase family 2 protein [Caulobacter sp.]|nr:glycosyltransferase family 2 protein [Caulobacter sp.]
MKVSILILTYNEAANLPACLAALSWCDDILVIDSGSTDDSVAIAKAHGARILTRPFDDFAGQRNFGLEHGAFRHDWILHLDADEIVTDQFLAALEALQPADGIDAYRVPFKTMFFGRWLRNAGMWPAYQVRLGHAQRLRFVQVGHGQREDLPPERVGNFPEALLHYSFSHGLRRWLDKHVRYAADEAAVIVAARAEGAREQARLSSADPTERRRAAKALAGRLPLFLRPVARFVYIYFVRRGFLDGRAGFVYAFMLSVYEAMMAILAYEQSRAAGANRIPPAKGTAS